METIACQFGPVDLVILPSSERTPQGADMKRHSPGTATGAEMAPIQSRPGIPSEILAVGM